MTIHSFITLSTSYILGHQVRDSRDHGKTAGRNWFLLALITLGAADGRRWWPARCAPAPDAADAIVGDNVERAENGKQVVVKRRPRRNLRVDWCDDAEKGEQKLALAIGNLHCTQPSCETRTGDVVVTLKLNINNCLKAKPRLIEAKWRRKCRIVQLAWFPYAISLPPAWSATSNAH